MSIPRHRIEPPFEKKIRSLSQSSFRQIESLRFLTRPVSRSKTSLDEMIVSLWRSIPAVKSALLHGGDSAAKTAARALNRLALILLWSGDDQAAEGVLSVFNRTI